MSDTAPMTVASPGSLERETKLSAWPGFVLPDLTDAVPGLTTAEPAVHTLDAIYHDAPDVRLGRAGITLRHRSGEGGRSGRWTLKVPADQDPEDAVMRRHELSRDAPSGAVPPALTRPVLALLRGAELAPVAARDRLIMELFYATGMRLTELVNLKEKDLKKHSR